MIRPVLIVMAKAPRIGAGKTRLAAELGRVEAWRINRRLQSHALRVACGPRWRTLLCVAPDSATELALPGVWPRSVMRIAQGRGDLGQRMARAFARRRMVAMIGTDCPVLTRAHIRSAFDALRRAPFALGPAEDGGFWLIAARSGAAAARAMANVRWSTRHAARDVIANIGASRVALLATLRDIDVAADLRG
ncbi:MAG: TIGR04282 family arsenosugar biosynthesis glycosyltransferase [Hyphomonadaceae bacterium]